MLTLNANIEIKQNIRALYKKDGYIVVPHGKDNGIHDQGINIIAKKEKKMLFI